MGLSVGVVSWWVGGRLAARLLADRGAQLMDLFMGAGARTARPTAPGRSAHRASVAERILWTVGIIAVVPQGLVPIGFAIGGVDPEVKVWFAARYLPLRLQVPAAVAFVAVGALILWCADRLRRRRSRSAASP